MNLLFLNLILLVIALDIRVQHTFVRDIFKLYSLNLEIFARDIEHSLTINSYFKISLLKELLWLIVHDLK